MKILRYEFSDSTCDYTPIELKGINLFVGASGAGKTRLFNTIFNFFRLINANACPIGKWNILFESRGKKYRYVFEAEKDDALADTIIREELSVFEENIEKLLLSRNKEKTTFEGTSLPRLPKNSPAISILKEEETVVPAFSAFGKIVRRNFYGDELTNAAAFSMLQPEIYAEVERTKSLEKIDDILKFSLNVTLSILEKSFKEKFKYIKTTFISLFPFVKDIQVKTIKEFPQFSSIQFDGPVLAMKEQGINKWTPISDFSSGMLKVLLILTDLAVMSEGSIYMIDEYENSLGINAIDFLPEALIEYEDKIQFLLISHHPYLINKIPVKDWYVFGRNGNHVTIKYGDEIKQRYGISKQQTFTQLVNDPFFVEGKV